MNLSSLPQSPYKTRRKRVGRGPGSGSGKTSGRGMNGAKCRSGYKRRYGFEGNQTPLHRRLPTRGFTRGRFAGGFATVSIDDIERSFDEGETVDAQTLFSKGLVRGHRSCWVKVIGNGCLTKKLIVRVSAMSRSARASFERTGSEILGRDQ